MAYNANERTVTTADIVKNSRGEFFRISRKIPNDGGRQATDVRQYYTDSASGEGRPTSKGVRLPDETVVDVMTAMFLTLPVEDRKQLMLNIENIDQWAADHDPDAE